MAPANLSAESPIAAPLQPPPKSKITPYHSADTDGVHCACSIRFRSSAKEIAIELEYVDSADSPLAIHHLHGDRHRQFRHHGVSAAALLGGLFAAAAALFAVVQRSVHVRAALCRQAARRARRCVKDDVSIAVSLSPEG